MPTGAKDYSSRELATIAVRDLKAIGRRIKPGALEAITRAFYCSNDVDFISRAVDEVVIPTGIEMPWGKRVAI